MEQCTPWEASSHSADPENPSLLQYPKVYKRVHKIRLLVPVQGQTNPIHTITDYFLQILFNNSPTYA
jgi:hypothetical protein